MRIKRAPLLGGILIIILLFTNIYFIQEYIELKAECIELQDENNILKDTIIEQEKRMIELKKVKSITQPNNKDFKSYMPFTAITNKSSAQWKLQQRAYTDEDGFRRVDGYPLVAIGTGWGCWVGDTILVTCENGNSFKAMVGDIKADRHTTADNKTTLSNNCRCEFIIDPMLLNNNVKRMGNAAVLEKYSGYVIDIVKQ